MTSFDLFLFSTDPQLVTAAVSAGVTGIIVDWEFQGKKYRQAGRDTEINNHTHEDLVRVRDATKANVICRINGFGADTPREIAEAISGGANEILLPMVRSAEEVGSVLELIAGRCGLGILIETVAAVEIVGQFAAFPLTRIYVGLNDLAISRGVSNLFLSVADGTVDYIRKHVQAPFGFGGLTVPDSGHPIPCRMLMGEMARLNCQFSFLRRSFCRDTIGKDLNMEVPKIQNALSQAWLRSEDQVKEDMALLIQAIRKWSDGGNG